MSKVRINDLARELEVKSRSILDALDSRRRVPRRRPTPARSKPMRPRRCVSTSRRKPLRRARPGSRPRTSRSSISLRSPSPATLLKAILERKQAEAAAKAAPRRVRRPSSPRRRPVIRHCPQLHLRAVVAAPLSCAPAPAAALPQRPGPRRAGAAPDRSSAASGREYRGSRTGAPAIASKPPVGPVIARPPVVVAPASRSPACHSTGRLWHTAPATVRQLSRSPHLRRPPLKQPRRHSSVVQRRRLQPKQHPCLGRRSSNCQLHRQRQKQHPQRQPARPRLTPGPSRHHAADRPPPHLHRSSGSSRSAASVIVPSLSARVRRCARCTRFPSDALSAPGARRPMHPTRTFPGGPARRSTRPSRLRPRRPGRALVHVPDSALVPAAHQAVPRLLPGPGEKPSGCVRRHAPHSVAADQRYEKTKEGPMKGFAAATAFWRRADSPASPCRSPAPSR